MFCHFSCKVGTALVESSGSGAHAGSNLSTIRVQNIAWVANEASDVEIDSRSFGLVVLSFLPYMFCFK